MDTTINIIHEGRNADEGKLDLYDSSETLNGFARSVNLVAEAFVNDNVIKERQGQNNGFTSEFTGAKRGCFELSFLLTFEGKAVAEHGHSVILDRFWDYFSVAFNMAVGLEYSPRTKFVNKIFEEKPYVFDQLAEQIEGPLVNAHRTIKTLEADVIRVNRPRVGDKVVFNRDTYRYISETTRSTDVESWTGNVTKYNLLTGYGRFYVDEEDQTVPFLIKDFGGLRISSHQAAASSMQEASKDITAGKRIFSGYAIRDLRRRIKRVEIVEIGAAEIDE